MASDDFSGRWHKRVPVLLWPTRDAFTRVVQLMESLKLKNVQEVFIYGFALLEWYNKFYRPGCKIMFQYPETPDTSLVTICEDPPHFHPVTKH